MADKTLDITALREIAKRGSPGPWVIAPSQEVRGAWRIDGVAPVVRATADNATHIATFDPTTSLAILDRLENAESASDHWERLYRRALIRAEASEAKFEDTK